MTTISVPITSKLEESINHLIASGYGSNKADVVRRAITKLAEDEAVLAVLQAEQEVKEGKIYRGDLRDLLNKI
jgi:Arc/MetJ-type ribon-helix-helix transcriptional regulator